MMESSPPSHGRLCLICNLTFKSDVKKCPADGSPLVLVTAPTHSADMIPGFQLLAEIGNGATGKVYRATNCQSNGDVAIKIMHANLINHTELVGRFNREAELTSRLCSPNTVAVKQFGWLADGRPYLVMDYVQGICASSLLDGGFSVPLSRALPIFIQVASGLAHAHSRGVMHRDIKPNNIMLVSEKGVHDLAKIVDFGIAKHLTGSENQTVLTRAGEALGSPVYMSPEQCSGSKIDHRTDIYSLGCVMYELLAGRSIFEASTPFEMMTKQIHETPRSLGLPKSAASIEVERIIFKAVQKHPDYRYQTADEIQRDLESCLKLAQSGSSQKRALDGWEFYSC